MVVDSLDLSLFSAPIAVSNLYRSRCREVPTGHGVYVVRRVSLAAPVFLKTSAAGWFKGIDPSYPLADVERNWVPHASVVYIGKAGGGRGLRQRLMQLIDFAYGKPIGHRGGRMLWHLSDWADLHIQWGTCPSGHADELETALINQFRQALGVRPFANMAK